jgi:hypothetical protein
METWRCPTCLAVLRERAAKRCPQCHSRLRKRRSRLDRLAALIVDRQNQLEAEHVFAASQPPSAPAWFDLPPDVEAGVAVEPEPSFQTDDVNSIVDALHRKARGERRAFPDANLFD